MTVGNNHQPQDWQQQLEQLSAYLDNELDERERAALEAHLPTCEQCQQALAELRETRLLLQRLPAPALPRSFTLPETGAIPAPIATRRTATTAASATRQRAGSGRLLQWIGSVAAAIGLFFLIGSALGGVHLTSSGANTANAPTNYGSSARSTSSQQANSHTQEPGIATGSSPVPKTPTSTTAANASPTSKSNPQFTNNAGTSPPVGELAGTVLLVGGAGLLVSGTVLVRRKKRA